MAPRSLDESYRIVAEAIGSCTSLPTGLLDPAMLAGPDGVIGKSFADFEFDSLAYMEFCIAIHVESGVELNVATVVEMASPDAVARHLSGLG